MKRPVVPCFEGWGSLCGMTCPTCVRSVERIGDNARALRLTGKQDADASYLRSQIYWLIQREPGGPERVSKARGIGSSINESDLAAIGGAS